MNIIALRRSLPAAVGLVALWLLYQTQQQLELRQFSLTILISLLVGWGITMWCSERQPPFRDQLGALQPNTTTHLPIRIGLSVLAFGLAVVTWRGISGNVLTTSNTVSWLGAVGVWLVAWWPWQRKHRTVGPIERRNHWLALALVLLVTAFGGWLRFHRLYFTPGDMTQDHSWKLLDVQTVLDGGRPIFFPNNTGREAGQFYYIAFLIRLFNLPRDFMALKIGNAIVGTATIPIIYLFARELGGRKLGLIAALLYSIGKWPLATTRMGLRYPYATLPAALVLWSLWRYVRLGKRTDALLVGVWMGLGLHGYLGVRAVPFAIIAVFGLMLFDPRRRTRQGLMKLVGHGLLILVTTALLFLPLGHFMQEFPDQFWYRVATRTTDKERSIQETVCKEDIFKPADPNATINPTVCKAGIFVYNNLRMLLAFNWEGDVSQVNTVSKDPFVDVMTATLLLLAVPLLVWRLFVERSLRWWMTVIALPLLLLSTTLNIAFPIENPSTVRTGVAMPVLFTIAAAPLALLLEWIVAGASLWHWRRIRAWRIGLATLTVATVFTIATQQNYTRYFKDFDRQYSNFVPNTGEIAQAIKAYSNRGITNDNAFFAGWPYWFESRALSVHLGDIAWHETHELRQNEPIPPLVAGQPRLYVLNREDEKRRTELQQTFPNGELKFVATPVPSKSFYLFYIPAQ